MARHPLFHVLVTLGCALTSSGCSGKSGQNPWASQSGSDAGGSDAGGSDAGPPMCPYDCPWEFQFTCEGGAGGGECRCDESRPAQATDCESPWYFACDREVHTGCVLSTYSNCVCDETSLTPDQCAHTQQFQCDFYEARARAYPNVGPYEGCYCDETAPLSADDCPPDMPSFSCEMYDPPIGCTCDFLAMIR